MAAAAVGTVGAAPDAVELFGGGINQSLVVSQDAGLEVATVAALHSNTGTGQIGGAYLGVLEIKYKNIKMDSWA